MQESQINNLLKVRENGTNRVNYGVVNLDELLDAFQQDSRNGLFVPICDGCKTEPHLAIILRYFVNGKLKHSPFEHIERSGSLRNSDEIIAGAIRGRHQKPSETSPGSYEVGEIYLHVREISPPPRFGFGAVRDYRCGLDYKVSKEEAVKLLSFVFPLQ